ncbi:MAG: acetyl-CoA carboxylase biotin carboxylase subunit [Planctomycetota bacterium]|nr:MAG: acetyl-CoA carboxylase biotin carboxylase subunit [Planctomycetota bacterium]
MFQRILIANRGEIAYRIAKSCKKLGIMPVFAYSEADKDAKYLRDGVEKICIGPGPAVKSYLDSQKLLASAIQKDCQALHPGYGFLSENPYFAYLVRQAHISFVGPPPWAISKMGDKVEAKKTMRQAGVPLLPGNLKKILTIEEGIEEAREIGYPVLIKASAGGGGRGMKLCQNEEELRKNFPRASREALQAFGDPSLYFERYLDGAKHIEFQILIDHYGQGVHLGERECSIQRRHQKLIEESPSPALSYEIRSEIGSKAVKALVQGGYSNAGTVEFLSDGQGNLYFMEVNARLQVEHPVTEMVVGMDLVEEQIRIAAGHPLSVQQKDIQQKGHAIEFRINAEDPRKNFLPCPGTIQDIKIPEGKGIRFDSHIEKGYQIPPYYDSMIGKLIIWAETREKAIQKSKDVLKEVRIEGIPTTIPLHLAVLENREFQNGSYHLHTLEEILKNFNP